MSQTVIGVFATRDQANQAVQALHNAGYNNADIDVSARESSTQMADVHKRRESVGGFFSSLFGDDDNHRNSTQAYTEIGSRGTVVTVHTQQMDSAERAADILDQYGAMDADQSFQQLNTRHESLRTSTPDFQDDHTLEVIKEDLAVGKREVSTGGVRVRSRVVSRPVTAEVRLREEEVFVERRAVDRPASSTSLDSMQEGEVVLTETAEVPVVEKSARVVEEIEVGKRAHEKVETIHETVRETEVDVEQMAGTASGTVSNTTGRDAGGPIRNALDRDNDGELISNDGDGRIG